MSLHDLELCACGHARHNHFVTRRQGCCCGCQAFTLQPPSPCPACCLPDGTLNTNWADEYGTCAFGCGNVVDSDTGFCPSCKEHSANEVSCTICGAHYESWDGWQRVCIVNLL